MADDSHSDPFHGLSFIPDQTKGPAARRTAFREDPHGILTLGEPSACQIIRDGNRISKAGSRILPEEGTALQLAHSLALPAPAVHEVRVDGQRTSIVMDFVEGECLEEAWPLMDAGQKRSVAEQLRDIIIAMRQATPNQNTIGACGGPARDCRRYADYSGGPFNYEAEFNDFVLDFLQGTPSLIRSTISDTFDVDNRIVFTHGDLSPRNLIVKEGRIQALLDWEFSGWYPEYWEYVKFFEQRTDCRDWKEYAKVIFDTRYPKELLTHQALARWQRP